MRFYHASAIYSKLLVLPALGFMVLSTAQLPRYWRTEFLQKGVCPLCVCYGR